MSLKMLKNSNKQNFSKLQNLFKIGLAVLTVTAHSVMAILILSHCTVLPVMILIAEYATLHSGSND